MLASKTGEAAKAADSASKTELSDGSASEGEKSTSTTTQADASSPRDGSTSPRFWWLFYANSISSPCPGVPSVLCRAPRQQPQCSEELSGVARRSLRAPRSAANLAATWTRPLPLLGLRRRQVERSPVTSRTLPGEPVAPFAWPEHLHLVKVRKRLLPLAAVILLPPLSRPANLCLSRSSRLV